MDTGKDWRCLQRLTQGLPPVSPGQCCPTLSAPPTVLNSTSPGNGDGAAAQAACQIHLGLPDLISNGKSTGKKNQAVILQGTCGLSAQRSHHASFKGREKVQCLPACNNAWAGHPKNAHPCWDAPPTDHGWRSLADAESRQVGTLTFPASTDISPFSLGSPSFCRACDVMLQGHT